MPLLIHTDGGSRGNPGKAAIGFTVHNNDVLLAERGEYIGQTTNNVAEYTALIKALEWVQAFDGSIDEIECRLDSELVVKQLTGMYKLKQPHLKVLRDQVDTLCHSIIPMKAKTIHFKHIPREENGAADALVNRALDALA